MKLSNPDRVTAAETHQALAVAQQQRDTMARTIADTVTQGEECSDHARTAYRQQVAACTTLAHLQDLLAEKEH